MCVCFQPLDVGHEGKFVKHVEEQIGGENSVLVRRLVCLSAERNSLLTGCDIPVWISSRSGFSFHSAEEQIEAERIEGEKKKERKKETQTSPKKNLKKMERFYL